MARTLVMLRHGQTEYNATQRMQGQLDTHLSAVGVRQARAAALGLKHLGIVKVVSSDLVRAKDTADVIAATLDLEASTDPRLRETHLGEWQGLTRGEVDTRYVGARAAWRHKPEWAPPQGESRVEVARRARPVIDDLMADFSDWEDNAVLVVSHSGTIAALTAHLLGLEVGQYPLLSGLKNTNYVQLTARPEFNSEDPAVDFTPETADRAQWYLDAWNQGLGV